MKMTLSTMLCVNVALLSSISQCSHQKLRDGISAYGTHFPALATIVANTQGPILEMGCGDYSTPMLHALCAPTKRMLVSTDVHQSWLSLFLDLQRSWHTFAYVPAYEKQDQRNNIWYCVGQDAWDSIGQDIHWSVVLIDHSPGLRRVVDIERLRKNTDIFVIHDTEDARYGYDRILNSFKYKYVYDRYNITTTVVSDTIDIATFFEA